MLRMLTAGESHGPCLTVMIDGLPAGLVLSLEQINDQLARRQQGYGRGGRMNIERDTVEVLSGVRFGKTLGSPLTMQIRNRDFANWQERMAAFGPEDEQRLICPRPGHADLSGIIKYRHHDIRNILERASARETACKVAAGAVAQQFLEQFDVRLAAHVTMLGGIPACCDELDVQQITALTAGSQLNCCDREAEQRMIARIDEAKQQGDTLGGVVEVIVEGLPVGLGSYTQSDLRLDGQLAGALMSIPAIKGVEFGLGFRAAEVPGSQAHDEIFYHPDRGYFRHTNRAGGVEGGMTNGERLVVRAAMKPIPTLMQPLASVDIRSKQATAANKERSDVCAVPAAAVVAEAVVAWELAKTFGIKFGGDSMEEIIANFQSYQNYVHGV